MNKTVNIHSRKLPGLDESLQNRLNEILSEDTRPHINADPLVDLLTYEITIEEFEQKLDQIYFECSQLALKNPDEVSDDFADNLFYIHKLKQTLSKCQ